MDIEEALLALCAEAAIGGGRVLAIVCDEQCAKMLHGEGAMLYTGCGAVEVRVEPSKGEKLLRDIEAGLITREEAMRGIL